MMKFKVNNNTGAPVEYEKEIHSLCNFAQQRIGFERPPSIFLDDDRANATNTLAKTGYYDPNTMEIHVFATSRHPKDILRSIAHELVHHGQNMRGELDTEGYSGKGYAQKNPKLRKAEMEANDPMLFRDWEDSLKEKENTIYNERRNRKMSIKDWKNKELNENLTRKWGFKMDLSKLSEGFGEEKYGMQDIEAMEPPMSGDEVNAIQMCVDQKVAQGVPMEIAGPECEKEIQAFMDREGRPPEKYYIGSTPGENPEFSNLIEAKKKKPDEDGDGVPDWADKKPGKDDHSGDDEKDDSAGDDEKSEKKPDAPKRRDRFDKNKKDTKGDKEKVDELKLVGNPKDGPQKLIDPEGEAELKKRKKKGKEKVGEAAIGGDKAYLEKLLAKYGPDAKVGDVAKKEQEDKNVMEASSMSGGNAHGHAGGRRRK